MTNEIVYTNIELDEVALGGEVFKKAREFSSGGSPISAPQSQSTTSNRSIDYKKITDILDNLSNNENYLKSFNDRQKKAFIFRIKRLFLNSKTKSPETFIFIGEQQKATSRTTLDITPIINQYKLNSTQKEDFKNFIIDFIKIVNAQTNIKIKILDKDNIEKSSLERKSISEIERLINEIGKTTLFQNWKNIFDKLLSFIDQKVVNEDITNKIIKMYNFLHYKKKTPSFVPDERFYTYVINIMTNDILTPLGFNDDQIKIILYSFKKCLENYFRDKNKVKSEIKEINSFVPLHIDFSKSKQLNESFLRMFGTAIEMIVGRMFGQDVQLPYLTISGSPQQMQALTDTLSKEKRYVDSYVKYGLDDPRTYQDQYKLQNAINNFERETGIKWPIK